MDEQKLTDWFPPEVLPARPGWYLREYKVKWLINVPDYFDGSHWFVGFSDWTHGANICGFARRWRGLAEPPLTDWFDPDTPPVHPGVYEIDGEEEGLGFAHWSPNRGWGLIFYVGYWGVDWSIRAAFKGRFGRGLIAPCRRWRGLAVQP